MPRKILVTNDDGVDSPGLWALVRAVMPVAREVVVVAPSVNQSAVGAGFTLRRELQWARVSEPPADVEAWHVDGTPADCVMVALDRLLVDRGIDMVVSGVNRGANVGNDVLASGTVGGALQGHFRGFVALAFSQAFSGPYEEAEIDWSVAERVAAMVCRMEAEGRLPGSLFLNVNVPACSFDEIAGMLVTRMGRHGYVRLQEITGTSAVLEREAALLTHPDAPPGTDIWALAHDYVSVSPLQANLTDHRLLDLLGQRLNAAFRG
ncbi:MAG: 5'/3'-nucleotidase SurE [Dehalococcoidia bacterium]|nr:5'/3'-nucleotidase SurE [Dehalococcoidia bacterium]